jgi:hypothetical protein
MLSIIMSATITLVGTQEGLINLSRSKGPSQGQVRGNIPKKLRVVG